MSKLKLLCGDCLDVMKNIPDNSVHFICTDLPYNTTEYDWDAFEIPLDKLWAQYKRILVDNGTVAMFGTEPFSTRLRMANMEWFKYDWIWKKNTVTGFIHAKNMPLKDFEIISIFSGGAMGHANLLGNRRMTYNPQGLKDTYKVYDGRRIESTSSKGKRPSDRKVVQEKSGYPRMIVEFDSVVERIHPTEKPVHLLEYLIRTYTNDGETVLDSCMGSGSCGVAAMHERRNFIGIEKDEGMFQLAKQRIDGESAQISLFY